MVLSPYFTQRRLSVQTVYMSEARALTNLIGNGVATVVAAKWENELDMRKLDVELNTPQ
jgi:aerobic C4-dicarboxylate transport protein